MERCSVNRRLLKWVFLGLITLNIYNIVVLARLGKDLNRIQQKLDVPGKKLMNYVPAFFLGIITLGIFPFVWEVKAISRTYTYARKANTIVRGGPRKVILFRILLVWTIVCPFIAVSNLLKTANYVCKWYNNQLENQIDSFLAPTHGDYIDLPELIGEDSVEEEKVVEEEQPIQEEAAMKPAPKAETKKKITAKAEPKKTEEKPMAKPAAKPAAKKPAAKPAAKPAPKAAAKPAPKAAAKPEPKEGKRVYHVAKREDGMWAVKFAGGEKAIKLFKTKVEAEAYTKQMAKNQGGVMLTHNSKGANKGKIAKK